MLAKLGTALPPRGRFTLHEINAAMDKAKLSIDHRMEVKTALANAGFLENSANSVRNADAIGAPFA